MVGDRNRKWSEHKNIELSEIWDLWDLSRIWKLLPGLWFCFTQGVLRRFAYGNALCYDGNTLCYLCRYILPDTVNHLPVKYRYLDF